MKTVLRDSPLTSPDFRSYECDVCGVSAFYPPSQHFPIRHKKDGCTGEIVRHITPRVIRSIVLHAWTEQDEDAIDNMLLFSLTQIRELFPKETSQLEKELESHLPKRKPLPKYLQDLRLRAKGEKIPRKGPGKSSVVREFVREKLG